MHILLITTPFPPQNNGGIGRPYSLYKYLPSYGIDVTVVTKKLNKDMQSEESVIRTDSFINWREYPLFSFKRISRYFSIIGYKYFHISTDSWWAKNTLKEIDELMTQHKFDVVYATFPAIETIDVGIKVSRKFNIPLLVEFRDGLVYEPCLHTPPNFMQRLSMKRLEKKALAQAKRVITIGNNISDYFRSTYKRDIHTVFNGYDSDDFKHLSSVQNPVLPGVKMAYFGSMNGTKKAERSDLFYAIQKLKNDRVIHKDNFELSFIGNIGEDEKTIVDELQIADFVKFKPAMNKREGLMEIKSKYNYLLFYGVKGERTIISSKLLEYLNLGMPVLGICKGNEAADIIEMTGTGEVCDFDVDSIYALIQKALNKQINYAPKQDVINSFDRKRQAGEIADIIKSIGA